MFSEYLNPQAELDEPVRYGECPWCGPTSSKAFIVTRVSNGYLMYCHKCGKRRKIFNKKASAPSIVKHRLKVLKDKPVVCVRDIRLPRDFTLDIPSEGIKWLSKYGISDTERIQWRFGYSEFYDRLILPVFQGEELVYWQGRNLGKVTPDNPKYLNVSSERSNTWFFPDKHPDKPIVLVEDILSCLSVIRAGYNGLSLLGCSINDELISMLLKRKNKVVIWLDPDKRTVAAKFARRMNSLGVETTAVLTVDKDPKDYGISETKRILQQGGT